MVMNHETLNGMIPLEVVATILKNGGSFWKMIFTPVQKKMVKLRNQPIKKVVAKDFQESSNFHQFPYKVGPSQL